MSAQQYAVNLQLGDNLVNDQAILYFSYQIMWDRGSKLDLLIFDPGADLHRALSALDGDPTPAISFLLEWLPSRLQSYSNKTEKHTLYLLKIGQMATPEGLCLRLRAVDMAYLVLNRDTSAYHASNVKASDFISQYLGSLSPSIQVTKVDTGDVAGNHRALQGRPLEIVRYELDRVLSSGGKPLSIQFDDRDDAQQLVMKEETDSTDLLESYSGGTYVYGLAQTSNQARAGASWGNTAYHYEMDQNYEALLWGHSVSVSHLTSADELVTGTVTGKNILGIKGSVNTESHRRISLPRSDTDNPTQDSYYANAMMQQAVFHSSISATAGMIMIDPDFKAFDGIDLLNRKHVKLAITGSSNDTTGNALLPINAVVMGFRHEINRKNAMTKVFVRRGNS